MRYFVKIKPGNFLIFGGGTNEKLLDTEQR